MPATLSQHATECFFGEPDGNLIFDFYPGILEHRARDIRALKEFQGNPSRSNLIKLLSASNADHVESLSVGTGISGEWFNKIIVGKNVRIGDNLFSMAHGGIELGDNLKIGKNVAMVTIGHGTHPTQRHLCRYGKIIIGSNVTIEDGAVLVHPTNRGPLIIPDGSTIRQNSLIMRSDDINKPSTAIGLQRRQEILEATEKTGERILKIEQVDQLKKIADVKNVTFLPPTYIRHKGGLSVGENCLFNKDSVIIAEGDITIGDQTLLAPKTCLHAPSGSSINIGDSVWIGAGVTIVAEFGQTIEIGSGSLVAAGAYITKSIPPNSLVSGQNVIRRDITDRDIKEVPAEWMDRTYMLNEINRGMVIVNQAHMTSERFPS